MKCNHQNMQMCYSGICSSCGITMEEVMNKSKTPELDKFIENRSNGCQVPEELPIIKPDKILLSDGSKVNFYTAMKIIKDSWEIIDNQIKEKEKDQFIESLLEHRKDI